MRSKLKKIYLVRHGQTDINKTGILQGGRVDSSINETGRKQAEAFYLKYQDVPFQKIYTSELCRSIESVESFIQNGIPFESLSELNEMDFGTIDGKVRADIEGGPYEQICLLWESGQTDLKLEGGESPKDVQLRMQKFIDKIRANEEEDLILVSMHGRSMRILLATMLHYELKEMHRFPHQNFGLYIVHDTGNQFIIETMNDCSHLSEYFESQPS